LKFFCTCLRVSRRASITSGLRPMLTGV